MTVGRMYRIDSVDLTSDYCHIVVTSMTPGRNLVSGVMSYEHVADIYLHRHIAELNMNLLSSGRLRENWMTILPREENTGREVRHLIGGKWSIQLGGSFLVFPNS